MENSLQKIHKKEFIRQFRKHSDRFLRARSCQIRTFPTFFFFFFSFFFFFFFFSRRVVLIMASFGNKIEYISPEGLRLDGRRATELRRIKCRAGVLSHAHGSAYYEQGNTKVLAAVFGPVEAKRGKALHDRAVITCEYTMAPFSTGERKQKTKGNRRNVEISLAIKKNLRGSHFGPPIPWVDDQFVCGSSPSRWGDSMRCNECPHLGMRRRWNPNERLCRCLCGWLH